MLSKCRDAKRAHEALKKEASSKMKRAREAEVDECNSRWMLWEDREVEPS